MRFVLLLFCVALMSCAMGDEQTVEALAGTSGKADGLGQDVSESLAEGYHFTISSSLTISEIDRDRPAKTYILGMAGIVFVESEPGQVALRLKPCVVSFPEVSGRQPELEPATVQNVEPVLFNTEFEAVDDSVLMRTSNGVMLAGVRLDNPATDPLPDSDDDERLDDLDGDNRPGVSLLVDGFKLYAALRMQMSLEGRIDDSGEVLGNGTMSIDIGTYGDNVPFVNAARAAEEAIQKLRVDDQEHLFSFRAVAPEAMGCDQVELVSLHPEGESEDSLPQE